MVNFCNPGFMDLKKFRDVFATPIVLGRDPNATPQQKLESQSRSSAVRIYSCLRPRSCPCPTIRRGLIMLLLAVDEANGELHHSPDQGPSAPIPTSPRYRFPLWLVKVRYVVLTGLFLSLDVLSGAGGVLSALIAPGGLVQAVPPLHHGVFGPFGWSAGGGFILHYLFAQALQSPVRHLP